jgi:hypothetical protein
MDIVKRGLLVVALVGVGACAESLYKSDEAIIKTRASFDLSCPEDQVRWRWLDDTTVGVIACGQRATYVRVCSGRGLAGECQFILNSDSRPGNSHPSGAEK